VTGVGAQPSADARRPLGPEELASVASIPRISVCGWIDRQLLVRSDRAGTPALWLVDVSTGAFSTALTPGEIVGAARATRDHVLFERDHDGDEVHQLFRTDRTGTLSSLVVEPGVIHDLGPVSADDRWVAYASNFHDRARFDVRVHDLETGDDKTVWSPGGYAFPSAWSPDGKRLIVGRIGVRSLETELAVLDLATREIQPVSPNDPGGALWGYADGRPAVAWRPDGRSFLFLTNAGREHLAIAEWRADDREWHYVLAAEHDLAFTLDPAGATLVVSENQDGVTRLTVHDATTFELLSRIEFPEMGVATDVSFSPDGAALAFVYQATARPPEVWAREMSGGPPRQVTHDAPASIEKELAPASQPWVESFDGERIQTLVYTPTAATPPYGTVIVLHGGPEMQAKQDFEPYAQTLAAAGFLVLRPNIRGSTGSGRRFASLDDGRHRLDALRDVVEIRRWAVDAQGADPGAVCLWGVSYGGLLTNLALAHEPSLWAAAVVAVAVSNLATFLETIAPWRRPIREAEYGALDDHRAFFEEIAPLNKVDSIVSPLLLVHGANDLRVPLAESAQLRSALAAVGREPQLIVFEDDGHHFDRVANRVRFAIEGALFLRRTVRTGG
jgi:dipeptidyl aminopeptidase/acylaminoacyl peptidase